jgi:L-seryl-tRNA(Ser) seleniumtransferase
VALAFANDVTALESALRLGEPAVIARVADGRLLVDLRSVPARDDDAVAAAVRAALRARS